MKKKTAQKPAGESPTVPVTPSAASITKMNQFYRAFPNLDALRLNLSGTHYRLGSRRLAVSAEQA